MRLKDVKDKCRDVEFQYKTNLVLKYFWLAFGIFGLLPFALSISIRTSIPILFFVSVYANYVSHMSTERALAAQLESRDKHKSSKGTSQEDSSSE